MVQAPEWRTQHDAWVACDDGTFVRWSAIETLSLVPAPVAGTAPRKYDGFDVVARLNRTSVVLGHAETKEEAEEKLRKLIGRLSHHYE